MKMKLENLVAELMKEIPEGLVPEAYVRNLVEENLDCYDTETEVTGETKMQLGEESGMEFMLSRAEAEDYLCYEIPDEKWEGVSQDNMISSRLVKALEDDEDSTLFEVLKSMPLIPAAKLIGSFVLRYLEKYGVQLDEEQTDELCVDVIEQLNMSLFELQGGFDDDDDDDDDDEDDDFDEEDVFEEMGIEFDTDDDMPEGPGSFSQDDLTVKRGRRSRITRFPGKK